jgi:hypothetical protein
MKNYETKLPDGYQPVYQIDAKDRKIICILNIVSLLLFAAVAVPLFAWLKITTSKPLYELLDLGIFRYLVLIAIYIAYIFAHELTHGAAYYALTRQHLSFGTSLFIAYCGVPNIYVYRMPALIAVLAPFVTYSILFSLGIILSVSFAWQVVWILALAVHVGGCVGDLWVAVILMFCFKGQSHLLVRDTGPKQTFYNK